MQFTTNFAHLLLLSLCTTFSHAFTALKYPNQYGHNQCCGFSRRRTSSRSPRSTLQAFFNQKDETKTRPKSILDDEENTNVYGVSFFPRREENKAKLEDEIALTTEFDENDDKSLGEMIGFGGIVAVAATSAIVVATGVR